MSTQNAPKFHGIIMAGDSYVENFAIETRDNAPSTSVAGKVWFRNGQLEYSEIDQTGATQTVTLARNAKLDKEITDARAAETSLQASIDAEKARAEGAESTLTTNLATEVSRATDAESDLQTQISNILTNTDAVALNSLSELVSDYNQLDSDMNATLQSKIDTETGRVTQEIADREAAVTAEETARKAQDDAIESSVGLNADGSVTLDSTNGAINWSGVDYPASTIKGAIEQLNKFMLIGGSQKLDDEIARAKAAEQTNANAISSEETRATSAESNLTTNLSTEISDRKAQDDVIEASVGLATDGSFEIVGSNYMNADSTVVAALMTLDSQIESFNTDQTATAASVLAELNTTQTGAGLNENGTYEANVASNFLNVATSLKDADEKLDAQVKINEDGLATEVADRTAAITNEKNRAEAAELVLTNDLADEATTARAAETANSNAITNEKNRAEAAELVLTNDLADEATTARAAETANSTAIDSEKNRAEAAELVLTNNLATEVTNRTNDVDAEETRAINAEGVLQTNINTEASTRSADDTKIVTAVNAMRYSTTSASATTHTITHGLASDNIIINVLTEQQDGSYANDIVPVSITDNNSFSVYLSESRAVRVSVMKMDAISIA